MQIVDRKTAAEKIKDGSTFAISGFCGFGSPDEILLGIRESYEETSHPADLMMIKSVSIGDHGQRGASRVTVPGLVTKIMCSHMALEPNTMKLVADGDAELSMVPLGTILKLLRAAASGQKDVITEVGVGTFADPDVDKAAVAEKLDLNGTKYLRYDAVPIDVAIIRMSTADEAGNLSCEREALLADQFEMAAAAYNSGGIVIVQVERIVPAGSIDPRNVKVHGSMVDYVVVSSEENHRQGFDDDEFRPVLTGEERVPELRFEDIPFSDRKICARRAYMEISDGNIVNLGIGMPLAVAAIAVEEGTKKNVTLSVESGVTGGAPLGGLGIGAAVNPEAFFKMADILDLYDGGFLDMTILGLAEVDRYGNVNVSKFAGRSVGPGGFIDISQNAKKVVFVGTFRTKSGKAKLIDDVEQITFSAETARKKGQEVLYITECAVFRLLSEEEITKTDIGSDVGIELIEIAPGVDLEKDILANMTFKPIISNNLKTMDDWLFSAHQ